MLQSLWMLVAAFFFACMSALVKQCSLEAGTFEIVFFRAFLTLIFISVVMRMEKIPFKTLYPGKHVFRSICGAVAFTCWFAATAHLPLGTAVTLSYSGPIFIALATIGLYLKIGKRVPWLLVFSVLLGFIGICVMMHPTVSSDTLTWALTALVTGVLAPFIFMTVQKLGSLGEPSARIVFYFMLVSTLWGLAGVFVVEGGFHSHGTLLWVMLLGVGICSTLAQLTMTQAYAKGNLLITACFHFSTIPMAEFLSVFLFGDSLTVDALIGMALIFGAGILSSIPSKHAHHHP